MRAVASRMTLSQRRHAAHALRPHLRLDQWRVWDNVPPRTRTRLDSWFATTLSRYVHDYRDPYFGCIAVGPYDYSKEMSDRGSIEVSYVTQSMFEVKYGGEIGHLVWKFGTARTWLRDIIVYDDVWPIVARRATASNYPSWRAADID